MYGNKYLFLFKITTLDRVNCNKCIDISQNYFSIRKAFETSGEEPR